MVPMLPNLKYLGLSFKDDEALMQLALFLKASPCLQRLVMHVSIHFYLVHYSKTCYFYVPLGDFVYGIHDGLECCE